MTRLPTPGGDNGDWGDILNAFLEVSHKSDGTLSNNVVGTNQIQNNSVTNTQLDTPTQTAIAKANNAVPNTTTVNGHALSSNITLTASDVSAVPTSQLGASGGVATLTGTTLTSSQLPSSVAVASQVADQVPVTNGAGIYVNTNSVPTSSALASLGHFAPQPTASTELQGRPVERG